MFKKLDLDILQYIKPNKCRTIVIKGTILLKSCVTDSKHSLFFHFLAVETVKRKYIFHNKKAYETMITTLQIWHMRFSESLIYPVHVGGAHQLTGDLPIWTE